MLQAQQRQMTKTEELYSDIMTLVKNRNLDLYVKDVFILENEDASKTSLLPFFADGYPGIMFQQSENGVFRHPHNKLLSDFFLYGQTLVPIELAVTGAYRLIVFQLYPFAARTLFGVNPKELNDDCYDFNLLQNIDLQSIVDQLSNTSEVFSQAEIIATFLSDVLQQTLIDPNQKIQVAVNLILTSKGKISVKTLTENLHITERTLQRQFIEYVGISPKQLAKIIQFQSSLNLVSDEVFSRLTDIVYENGYADQSHFIRSFKKYTGRKPSAFKTPK